MHDNAVSAALFFLLLLQVKHFICDGPLQTKDMVQDKGIYGLPRGLLHAGLHGLGTFIVCVICRLDLHVALAIGAIDGLIHYHLDFTKERLVRSMGWGYSKAQFWWAMVGDQFLHSVCYIAYTAYIFA